MKTMIIGLSLILLFISPAIALPPDSVGHIQTIKGPVSILRGNNTVPAAAGVPVYLVDTIRTAKMGSVGIVLTDDTTFSLGPNSEIVIKDYLFNPKEGKFSLITRMAKGTFSYLSGMIGKLSPNSILLEIPDATIAVRGTKLLIKIDE